LTILGELLIETNFIYWSWAYLFERVTSPHPKKIYYLNAENTNSNKKSLLFPLKM